MRKRRFTADWDFKNPFKLLFYIHRAIKLMKGTDSKIIIKKSHSKGFHLFLWSRINGVRKDIRYYLGDDIKHLFLDAKHTYGKQTLFHKKKKLN